MSLFRTLYNITIEALFPLSPAEKELFSYSEEKAYAKLPRAPISPLPNTQGIFAYKDERVSRLVWNIKYKKSALAVRIGGYALWRSARSDLAILLPMPITPKRRRERGFNQCELLVNEIKSLDEVDQFTVRSDLLLRIQNTSRQTLKNRSERLEDAKGIFSLNGEVAKEINKDAQIIVIDDVITTGSTMKEAMETLKIGGFENVRGVSLAH